MLLQQATTENTEGAHFLLGLFYHKTAKNADTAAYAYYNANCRGDLRAIGALDQLIHVATHLQHKDDYLSFLPNDLSLPNE